MLEASQPVLLLDYFRVPYRLDGLGDDVPPRHPLRDGVQLRWTDDAGSRSLLWPSPAQISGGAAMYTAGDIPVFARVLPDAIATGWLAALGGGWDKTIPVRDARGDRHASIWRSEDGSLFLPFDPAEAITSCWSEAYRGDGRMRSLALRAYYRARPAIPRAGQLAMQRAFSQLQRRRRFPRWPIEPALHDLYDRLLGFVAELARVPVPMVAPWPGGRSWALVLTHDVESAEGYRRVDSIRRLEKAHGLRSAWNFVPRRYAVDDADVRDLAADGFEVGVHGLYHDGRDLASLAVLAERLPAIRAFAERWQAAGFRAPAMHRVWEWMERLGFDYDSSYPDTDPFEPQPGGCCTWLPYFNGDLVELPVTLPQDHTLFTILRHQDESVWLEKTAYLKRRGGLALVLTHPDYLADERLAAWYERYLDVVAGDTTAWQALPRDVADWWRRRASSRPELVRGTWTVVGPAADEGRVDFIEAR